jgi:hypothetical protein
MRSCDLTLELRLSLCETLRDDVIDKRVTVGQRMTSLAASKARVRVRLILRHGADEEVDLLLTASKGTHLRFNGIYE